MTLENLYKAFIFYVQNSKHGDIKYQESKLQTFAVLQNYFDLNTENLGRNIASKGKPFFWSREWARSGFNPSKVSYNYPLMGVIETGYSIQNPFRSRSMCHSLEIVFLDKVRDNCGQCIKDELLEELYIRTKKYAISFLTFLKELNVMPDDTFVFGSVTGYDAKKTSSWQKELRFKTNIDVQLYSSNTDNLHGVVLSLNLCFNNCDTNLTMSDKFEYTEMIDSCKEC